MNTFTAKYTAGDIKDLDNDNFKTYSDEVTGYFLNDVTSSIIYICRNTTAKPWDFIITTPEGRKMRPSKEKNQRAWS